MIFHLSSVKPQASRIDVTLCLFLFSLEAKSFLGKVHFFPHNAFESTSVAAAAAACGGNLFF